MEDQAYGEILGLRSGMSWLDQHDAPLRGYRPHEICDGRPIPGHEYSIIREIRRRVKERLVPNCALFCPAGAR
jgi:hypothetical protein